jgi:hypothetical protein
VIKTLLDNVVKTSLKAGLCQSQLAGQQHRLQVARNDVNYYRDKLAEALDDYADADEAHRAAWLALINSGLSHRRVLYFARHIR